MIEISMTWPLTKDIDATMKTFRFSQIKFYDDCYILRFLVRISCISILANKNIEYMTSNDTYNITYLCNNTSFLHPRYWNVEKYLNNHSSTNDIDLEIY